MTRSDKDFDATRELEIKSITLKGEPLSQAQYQQVMEHLHDAASEVLMDIQLAEQSEHEEPVKEEVAELVAEQAARQLRT